MSRETRDREEPTLRIPACLDDRFAQKSLDEIELNLRAWHALGDRSLLPMLRFAGGLLFDSPLAKLPDELVRSFPRARDPMALMDLLNARFAESPELGPEIRRILDDFDPTPWWMRNEKYSRHLPEFCGFELEPREQELIGAFLDLKSRVDQVPTKRITSAAAIELMLKKGTAKFGTLAAAHDTSDDPHYRMLVRLALYAQHPREASIWALCFLEEIGANEIVIWVQNAPVEWLLANEDLYRSWLHHENSSVRSFAAGRLNRAKSLTMVVPFCVQILEEGLERLTEIDVEAIESAMRTLARTKDKAHVALLMAYTTSPGHSPESSAVGGASESVRRRLASSATTALLKLGADVRK